MARDPEDPIESIQCEVERMFRDLVYHGHPASHFGEFKRTIELPWEAEEGTVEARYRNGMLEIHLKPVRAPSATDVTVEHRQSR